MLINYVCIIQHISEISTLEGTAKPDMDYQPVDVLIELTPNQVITEFEITLPDNERISPNDVHFYFYITLSLVDENGDIFFVSNSTVVIQDDECKNTHKYNLNQATKLL